MINWHPASHNLNATATADEGIKCARRQLPIQSDNVSVRHIPEFILYRILQLLALATVVQNVYFVYIHLVPRMTESTNEIKSFTYATKEYSTCKLYWEHQYYKHVYKATQMFYKFVNSSVNSSFGFTKTNKHKFYMCF